MTEASTRGASQPATATGGEPTEDAERGAEARPPGDKASRLRTVGPPVLAILAYLAIAALAFWPVEPFSRSRLLGCACSDPVQETWFLAWPAYAITHGRNPFFSSLLDNPHGVNLALNTSMPLLGVLSAPITWLRGPVAAFNAMMRLSFAISATSMLFVVRRFTRFWPAAFFAGLLYGFSPYMVGQGFGHLFLTFVPLPPLIALCLYEICRRPDRPVLRLGLLLGALCVAQYLISLEVLVTTGICCAAVAVVAALRHPVGAVERVPRVLRAAGCALAIFAPLAAYPTWFFLRGPQHVVGPPHAVSNIAPVKADLLGPLVPTLNQRIGPAHLIHIGTSFGAGDRPENGIYLGIPLLVLLIVLVIRFRREDVVMLGAVLTAVGFVLALGTPLIVDNHPTTFRLPFDVLVHIPLVKGVEALRFSLFEQMGAAVVLGLGLDRARREGWWRQAAARLHAQGARSPVGSPALARSGAVVLVGAAALVPLLPRYPYPSPPVNLPGYFTTGADRAVPRGSVVLTYPYDIDPDNEAMLWQAVSGMRFAIFGGQASTPGPGGAATSAVPVLQPPEMQQLFRAAMYGQGPDAPQGAALPPLDGPTLRALRVFFVRYKVGTVVVEPLGVNPAAVVGYLSAALGRPPVATGGVDVWYGAGADAEAMQRGVSSPGAGAGGGGNGG